MDLEGTRGHASGSPRPAGLLLWPVQLEGNGGKTRGRGAALSPRLRSCRSRCREAPPDLAVLASHPVAWALQMEWSPPPGCHAATCPVEETGALPVEGPRSPVLGMQKKPHSVRSLCSHQRAEPDSHGHQRRALCDPKPGRCVGSTGLCLLPAPRKHLRAWGDQSHCFSSDSGLSMHTMTLRL